MWELPLSKRTRLLTERYRLHPKKRLGQSFLVNDQAAARLADVVGETEPPGVVEIGGGLGALTVAIARRLPRARLIVYEVDTALCQALADVLAPISRRCWVHCCDFLKASHEEAGATDEWALVGNLPYSLTTPILESIFSASLRWRTVVLMVQREFAQRMMAGPGSHTYGALSLFTQANCEQVERVMRLKPSSFWPKPEVESVVLRICLRRHPPECIEDSALFETVVRGAFNYRRKTLVRALVTAGVLGATEEQVQSAVAAAGLDPVQRPETLSLEEFAALTSALSGLVSKSE